MGSFEGFNQVVGGTGVIQRLDWAGWDVQDVFFTHMSSISVGCLAKQLFLLLVAVPHGEVGLPQHGGLKGSWASYMVPNSQEAQAEKLSLA